MLTVMTRAEELDASHAVECLAAHRRLAQAAHEVMRRLPLAAENQSDLLRLGASCVQIAAEQAFGSRGERDAILRWGECEIGEKQIRKATYHALRNGFIKNRDYDELFRVAAQAQRTRSDETQRLRRRLRQLAVI